MSKLAKILQKHYIGYIDERDEYQQRVISEILATANIYLSYLIIIALVGSLIFDGINHSLSFGTVALVVLQFINSYYISERVRKSGVNETEFYDGESYDMQIQKLKRQCIMGAFQWGIFVFSATQYIFPWILGEAINIELYQVVIWSIASIIFGTFMYNIGKSKIKRVY
ncbi:DUF3278 domain-containing protein [Clostridium perfringens]|nr:DUF3278 domain-containing protein [Clostridium perfringens]